MFSPRRLFSKCSSTVNFFKFNDANVEPIIDLPTPPDSPSCNEIPLKPSLQEAPGGFFQQSQSNRSAYSLPLRKRNRLDENSEGSTVRPTSATGSPFRSVTHMKEPFHLVLPNSPPLSQSSSRKSSTVSKTSQSRKGADTSQQLGIKPEPLCTARPPIALLPSPTFPDIPKNIANTSEIIFNGINAGTPSSVDQQGNDFSPTLRYHPPFVSTDAGMVVHEIQSSDNCLSIQKSLSLAGVEQSMHKPGQSRFSRSPPSTAQVSSESVSPNRSMRRRSSSRTQSVLSSEGDWLAGTLSRAESLPRGIAEGSVSSSPKTGTQKANQRRVQIVEHSPNSPISENGRKRRPDNRSPIGYATVVSTTNLRLVTICRTPSTLQFKDSSPSRRLELRRTRRPVTPDHNFKEVSAFSPETPPQRMIDSGYPSRDTEREYASSETQSQTIFRSGSLEGLSIQASPDTDDDMSPGKVIESYCRPKIRQLCFNQQPSILNLAQPSKLRHPPPVNIHNDNDEVARRCDEYSWTLNQLALSINDFPNTMLHLNNPLITHIQQAQERLRPIGEHGCFTFLAADAQFLSGVGPCRSPLSSSESCLAVFRKIFPHTCDTAISALSATLIAHRYLSLFNKVDRSQLSSSSLLEELESVPPKARSTLGIHRGNVTANQRREMGLKRIAGKNVEILGNIADRLLMTICGRVDEFMKRMLESIIELMMR